MIEAGRNMARAEGEPAPWVFDVLLGISVALTVSLFIASDISQTNPDPWAYLWAVGLGALMLVRRQYPVLVVIMSAAALISYYAAGYPPIGVAVPLAAAVFSAAEFGRVGAAVVAVIVVVGISVLYRLAVGQDPAYVVGYELPGHALLLAGAIALGDSVRSRRELRRQSDRIAQLTAERFARQAEQRVMAERLAIARELHDSVGHALTIVALHTQVVEEAVDTDDDEVRRSLKAIADTTAATFADLRRTVASLRKDGAPVRAPHRIADLESAIQPARQAGLEVTTHVHLRSPPSPTVDAAVYRMVQESITNIVRHTQATRADIDIHEHDGKVKVAIVNDGPRSPRSVRFDSADGGNGIAGMRERAHLLGGSFSAGPEGAGFAVRASIPLEVEER